MAELISIIMPAYQADAFIAQAVRSVFAQSYSHWELLIIADDQQDYERLLASQGCVDQRLHFYSTGRVGAGPNVARNVGLSMAQGEWIAPLDADDGYFPQRLEILHAAAGTSGLSLDNIALVGEGVSSVDADASNAGVLPSDFPDEFGFDQFRLSLVPLLFLFHRRHIHRGWDEDVVRGADTLFNLRALESAGHARFVAQAHHHYRVHSASMCHAKGAENIFKQAYAHTLRRLREDGLGFGDDNFRARVIAMLEEKRDINEAFDVAVQKGYQGNYQSFVKQRLGSVLCN